MTSHTAKQHDFQQGEMIQIQQNASTVMATVLIDDQVAENMIYLSAASPLSARLGAAFGCVELSAVREAIDA